MAAPVDPNKAIRIARFFAYPKQVIYLLVSFIFLVSLCHYVSLAYDLIRRRYPSLGVSSEDRTKIRWRRLPSALVDSLRAIAFRYTIHLGGSYTLNLAELGLTVGYIGVLFSWTFVNTTNLQGMRVDPKYFANRAGLMAATQIPIMTALGMRNNLISWLTGVSFDKLNYLHRLSARVICILGWIHGGGRITVGLVADEAIVNRWVQCGPLAVSTLTLMCILTVRPVRARAYELFLAVHFLFAAIFLLGVLFHLTGRTLTYYGAWPALLIWGIDRAIRVLQLLVYNPIRALWPFPARRAPETDAQITLLAPDVLRITVPRAAGPFAIRWRAGQCVFVSFPTFAPLASHPFTIASVDSPLDSKTKTLTFILRVRKGTTLSLAACAPASLPVLLNGPCSSPPILARARSAMLIAGGSGIAFTLPLLVDAVERAASGSFAPTNILFVWAVRDVSHITWIAQLLLPCLARVPPSMTLAIQFHVTSSTASSTSSLDDDADIEKRAESSETDCSEDKSDSDGVSSVLTSPFVRVVPGRPDVATLLSNFLHSAPGPVSVSVCGTHRLAESVRVALRTPRPQAVLRGAPTVTLHVEAFGG